MYSVASTIYSKIKAWPLIGTICTAAKPFVKTALSGAANPLLSHRDFRDLFIPPKVVKDAARLRQTLMEHSIGFFDFGCSHGGGTLLLSKNTGLNGLGFDRDIRKLKLALKNGIFCSNADILDIPDDPFVPFVIMFDFLEHLDSRTEAYTFIDKACRVSRDNVFISQPFHDADQLLFADGFKTYYSHWGGHRNSTTTTDFFYHLCEMKARSVISDFVIGYKQPIFSSDHEFIHSLASPIDSHKYNPAKHPPKQLNFRFSYDVFAKIVVAIDISGKGYGKFFKKLSPDRIAYDSKQI
jgi:hypothetical protein